MISQDTTKNILDSLISTGNSLFDNQVQNVEQRLQSLATSAQPPQFSPPISSSGDLPIRGTPLQGEAGGLFGAPRSSGNVHLGLDLAAPIGTGVVAAEDGIVVYAGCAKDYGNVVYINHAGGYQTRYAHLSEINVKACDSVTKGSGVGLVGKTGNADSPDVDPHVHFEVRKILDQNVQDLNALKAIGNKQSQALDPLPFLLGHPVVQAAQAQPRPMQQQKMPQQPKKYPEEQKHQDDQQVQKEDPEPDSMTDESKAQVTSAKTASETQKKGWMEKAVEKAEENVRKRIRDKLMKFLDTNSDGGVRTDELKTLFATCMEQFGGKITKNNLCTILRQQAGIDFKEREVADLLLAALDTNGDRVLTAEDDVNAMIQKMVKDYDANGDGQMSRDELDGLGKRQYVSNI